MGPEYELKVEDWLWYGYHDREHTDDIRRAMKMDWTPRTLTFLPEVEDKRRGFVRAQEGFLRAVYSVDEDAWNDPAHGEGEGWTYKDVLAHIASNEERVQIRFRAASGEVPEREVEAVNNVEAWNQERVSALANTSPADLVDGFLKNRNTTLEMLAGLKREDLAREVMFSGGTTTMLEFIDRISDHMSWHSGQLVSASRRAQLAQTHTSE
jgi:hypothetical protein